MRSHIASFPSRLADAADRYADLSFTAFVPKAIVCAGMGGSGIAANLVSKLYADRLAMPYIVCKDYTLPAFVGPGTLVICSSHSGNTEETLSAFAQAKEKGATICCLTAGGALLKSAYEESLNHVVLPTGMMPRACYPYGVVAQIAILRAYGLLDIDLNAEISQIVSFLNDNDVAIQTKAEEIAKQIDWRMPELLCDDGAEAVAIRFRQQLNENSKILCRNNTIPEQNHNEVLGRNDSRNDIVPLILRHDYENPRNAARLEFVKDHIENLVENYIEIIAQGTTKLMQMLYLVYLTDRVSLFLADIRGVDPQVIPSIDKLKAKMATVKN